MTRIAHYDEAERLYEAADALLASLTAKASPEVRRAVYTEATLTLQRALVHATLATMPA